VPKVQLVVELVNCSLSNNFKIVPPRLNYNILKIGTFCRCCIFIFVTQPCVYLVVQMLSTTYNVFAKVLNQMEKTSSLLVNHLHNRISISINDLHGIPICLCRILPQYITYCLMYIG